MFADFWLSLADKVTKGTYNYVPLIVRIILSSLPAADKTQWFGHLSFDSTLKLINDISSDLQKLLKHWLTQFAAFFSIPLAALSA